MGLIDEIKRLARPYEDEDADTAYEDEYGDTGRGDYSDRRSSDRSKSAPKKSDTPAYGGDSDRRSNKVLNIHTTTQLQVVLVKPDRFENAAEIADHLREKRTVVLNLESTNKDVARRILDFLSGAAYANDGKVKKVALSTYIITPYNVDILGDLIDELENNGLYF